jgi:hypothetical protein
MARTCACLRGLAVSCRDTIIGGEGDACMNPTEGFSHHQSARCEQLFWSNIDATLATPSIVRNAPTLSFFVNISALILEIYGGENGFHLTTSP